MKLRADDRLTSPTDLTDGPTDLPRWTESLQMINLNLNLNLVATLQLDAVCNQSAAPSSPSIWPETKSLPRALQLDAGMSQIKLQIGHGHGHLIGLSSCTQPPRTWSRTPNQGQAKCHRVSSSLIHSSRGRAKSSPLLA